MGGGASKEEVQDGTAVTGKWGKKVMMPPNVVGEQMRGGPKPGKKFLAFTPRGLVEMNKQKGGGTPLLGQHISYGCTCVAPLSVPLQARRSST